MVALVWRSVYGSLLGVLDRGGDWWFRDIDICFFFFFFFFWKKLDGVIGM